MRVALLLPGQIREAQDSFPFIKSEILDKYDTDVFISTWNPSGEINQSLHAETKDLVDSLTIDDLIKMYSPKHLKTDDFGSAAIKRFIDRAWSYEKFGPQTGEINPVSVFLMWYKIRQAFSLMEEYEIQVGQRYDCVIKGRMDIKIHNDLNLEQDLDKINVPPGFDWKGGVNDILAWGGRDAMEHYCKMFDYLEEYILSDIYFHPETLLRYHIESSEFGLSRPFVKVSLRGKNVWETEVSENEIDEKSFGYIMSRGNIWDT